MREISKPINVAVAEVKKNDRERIKQKNKSKLEIQKITKGI